MKIRSQYSLFWLATLLYIVGWVAWCLSVPHREPGSALFDWVIYALLLATPAVAVSLLLPALSPSRWTMGIIIGAAISMRIMLLMVDPILSDDLWRYLWDGEVQRSGGNPYQAAPADVEPERWNADLDEVRSRINHPHIRSVYPPLAQLLFRAVARGELIWRGSMMCFDIAVGCLVALALRRRGRDPRIAVLWWWHPLPMLECSVGGHVEIVAVLLVVAAMMLMEIKKLNAATVALAAGISVKLLPVGWLPLLWRVAGTRTLALLLLLLLVPMAFFIGTDLRWMVEGLQEYATSWYSGDLLYRPLGELLRLSPEDRWSQGAWLLRCALFCAWAWIAWRARSREPWDGFLVVSLAFVLLTPTLHPWYLLWLIPAAVVTRSAAAYLLSCTVLLQYRVLDGWRARGVWEEDSAMRWWVFAIPLIWFMWSWWRARDASEPSPGSG